MSEKYREETQRELVRIEYSSDASGLLRAIRKKDANYASSVLSFLLDRCDLGLRAGKKLANACFERIYQSSLDWDSEFNWDGGKRISAPFRKLLASQDNSYLCLMSGGGEFSELDYQKYSLRMDLLSSALSFAGEQDKTDLLSDLHVIAAKTILHTPDSIELNVEMGMSYFWAQGYLLRMLHHPIDSTKLEGLIEKIYTRAKNGKLYLHNATPEMDSLDVDDGRKLARVIEAKVLSELEKQSEPSDGLVRLAGTLAKTGGIAQGKYEQAIAYQLKVRKHSTSALTDACYSRLMSAPVATATLLEAIVEKEIYGPISSRSSPNPDARLASLFEKYGAKLECLISPDKLGGKSAAHFFTKLQKKAGINSAVNKLLEASITKYASEIEGKLNDGKVDYDELDEVASFAETWPAGVTRASREILLSTMMDDPRKRARAKAINVIGLIGKSAPESIIGVSGMMKYLCENLRDSEGTVRIAAANALRDISSANYAEIDIAITTLLCTLSDDNVKIRDEDEEWRLEEEEDGEDEEEIESSIDGTDRSEMEAKLDALASISQKRPEKAKEYYTRTLDAAIVSFGKKLDGKGLPEYVRRQSPRSSDSLYKTLQHLAEISYYAINAHDSTAAPSDLESMIKTFSVIEDACHAGEVDTASHYLARARLKLDGYLPETPSTKDRKALKDVATVPAAAPVAGAAFTEMSEPVPAEIMVLTEKLADLRGARAEQIRQQLGDLNAEVVELRLARNEAISGEDLADEPAIGLGQAPLASRSVDGAEPTKRALETAPAAPRPVPAVSSSAPTAEPTRTERGTEGAVYNIHVAGGEVNIGEIKKGKKLSIIDSVIQRTNLEGAEAVEEW